MKYLPLLWSGLWRKPVRTVLTFLSIVVAFLLFGLLQGVNAAFGEAVDRANVDRLLVLNRVSFAEQLPMAYLTQIARISGVKSVTFATWFGGYYQQPGNQVTAWVVDPRHFLALYPEYKLPPATRRALESTPDAVVAGSTTARRMGWTVGRRLPLHSITWVRKDGSSDWNFYLAGTYESSQSNSLLLINNHYFDEARVYGRGRVGWFIVEVADRGASASTASAIDRRFENSPDETKTVTEKDFARSLIRQLGDINFIVTTIMAAVFFTMLFLVWNTIAQSVRERAADFAVIKTLGFRNATVVALIMCETIVLCVAAAAMGLALAAAAYPALSAVVGTAHLSPLVVLEGIGVAVALAIVSSVIPGLQMGRMRIVDALARRG